MRAVSAPTVVILAAGEGTRMRSKLPKVLHPLCGQPLILWPVAAALGAVAAAGSQIDASATVVILAGDVPLITPQAIERLVKAHEEAGAAGTMATMEPDDPGQYGRVIRDAEGNVEKVVEAKGGAGDAT